MENQRIISYQQAADELRETLIELYGKKIFPRIGKIFADQLFLAGTEAGGYLSALADLDEIHVKRDIAQCALVRLKRAQYILETMQVAGYYTAQEAENLVVFFNKIIPAVKALLVEVYDKIGRDNAELLSQTSRLEETVTGEGESNLLNEETAPAEAVSGEEENHDPEGFYDII